MAASQHKRQYSLPPTLRKTRLLIIGVCFLSALLAVLPQSVLRRRKSQSRLATHLRYDPVKLQTKLLAHTPGFTALDNLIVSNGTMYIVSDSKDLPPLAHINRGDEAGLQSPSDAIQIIKPSDASAKFGSTVLQHRGVTLWQRDKSFAAHYAHWLEMLGGAWRIYAAGMAAIGEKQLELPSEVVLPLCDEASWRDKPQLNSIVTKAAFPGHAITYLRDLEERKTFGFVDLYSRIIISDRQATKFSSEVAKDNKACGGVVLVPASRDSWRPVRDSLFETLVPEMPELRQKSKRRPIVVTYITRQLARRRRLLQEDHLRLVQALQGLDSRFEVVIATLESLTLKEQFVLAGRTDIMVGLHGNGLAHAYWMRQDSLLIELLFPGDWARDFVIPSRIVGIDHVAIHNDTIIRHESMPIAMMQSDRFHGNDIPVRPGPILSAIRSFAAGEAFAAHGSRFLDDGSPAGRSS